MRHYVIWHLTKRKKDGNRYPPNEMVQDPLWWDTRDAAQLYAVFKLPQLPADEHGGEWTFEVKAEHVVHAGS